MKLLGVKKEENRLYSEWDLTYPVGWDRICRAAALIWEYTRDPELFTGSANGEAKVSPQSAGEVLELEESGYLTIRGVSEILKVPVMITFYNQLYTVRVTVISATEEFAEADYERFNLSMCQFMDSIELEMYR